MQVVGDQCQLLLWIENIIKKYIYIIVKNFLVEMINEYSIR